MMHTLLIVDDEIQVLEFVQMHDGTIDVESSPGKGTTFIIRLPKERRGGSL